MQASESPRLLQRERIIQVAGFFLMVSPFFNFFVPYFFLEGLPNKWAFATLWQVARAGSLVMWLLSAANIVIGFMMLKGRRASWLSVLIVLGFFIVYGMATLKRDMKSGWVQPVTLVLINMGLFALIYSQEFYQIRQMEALAEKMARLRAQTAQAPSASAPSPPEEASGLFSFSSVSNEPLIPPKATAQSQVFKAPLVEMDGLGAWARVLEIDSSKILMRALKQPPDFIRKKAVEISLGYGLVVRVRWVATTGSIYEFRWENWNQMTAERIQRWMEARRSRQPLKNSA